MMRTRLLGLVGILVLSLGGISLAEDPYTWTQVVERGMPNFNDQASVHLDPSGGTRDAQL